MTKREPLHLLLKALDGDGQLKATLDAVDWDRSTLPRTDVELLYAAWSETDAAEEAEAERLRAVEETRVAALGKLTREERDALGV